MEVDSEVNKDNIAANCSGNEVAVNSLQQQVVSDQTYEAQFFGFTPSSFTNGVYNAVLEYTWNCLQSLYDLMHRKYPSLVTEEDIEKASSVIFPYMTDVLDKCFDKFESYIMTNVCRIPDHVLLPEDEVHRTIQHTESDDVSLDKDIAQLEQQIKCERYMNEFMRNELRVAERVQATADQLQQYIELFDSKMHNSGVSNWHVTLLQNKEKIEQIKTLFSQMKTSQLVREASISFPS